MVSRVVVVQECDATEAQPELLKPEKTKKIKILNNQYGNIKFSKA